MKKHTVKMLSLALALVMLFTLMGCGKQETPDNSTNPNESTDDAHTPRHILLAWLPALRAVPGMLPVRLTAK